MLESIQYQGYEIKIHADECPENPRTEWDNLGKMVCFHSGYNLGDDHDFNNTTDFLEYLSGYSEDHLHKLRPGAFPGSEDLYQYHIKLFEKIGQDYLILQLFLYDHSGLRISAKSFYGRAHHAYWDSGPIGFIYISHKDIKKEFGFKKLTEKRLDKIENYLLGEIETYDNYLSGNVYYYTIEDRAGELIGSCGGFFGYDHIKSGLLDHARPDIEYHIKQQIKAHIEQLKTWIKNKVNYNYRFSLTIN